MNGNIARRSLQFIPTLREAPSHAQACSHQLLTRGGYIRQAAAGIYPLLPLGSRVLKRLEKLIDVELQKAPLYGNKLQLPLLSSGELWQQSGRVETVGEELMTLTDRKDKLFVLSPTHEESITHLVASLGPRNPKELPLVLYQITSKYRDEIRPRFGLLRAREFIMKDMYSFHENLECANRTYNMVCDAYERILTELKLPFFKVIADSGAMGGSHTHEYQVVADIGEDQVVTCDKCGYKANIEVLPGACENQNHEVILPNPQCGQDCQGKLTARRGIEVAHTFILGKKYTEAFNANVQVNESLLPMEMGCYGIGVTRIISACIECDQGHDEHGIIWPRKIAPFQAVVITAPGNATIREGYQKIAEQIVHSIAAAVDASPLAQFSEPEVMLDDRWNDSFGSKMAEAKLVGYPFVIVVGKSSSEDLFEVHCRASGQVKMLSEKDTVELILDTA